ncbi:MAG: serine hydrolase [Thermoanaerobaculia bacterium]
MAQSVSFIADATLPHALVGARGETRAARGDHVPVPDGRVGSGVMRLSDLGRAGALCIALSLLAASGGAAVRLAVTVDDLPWVGPLPAGDTAQDALVRMAAVLRVHGAPATGFVVCERGAADEDALESWAAWGLALGNHSWAHRDLDSTPIEEWLEDARRCDRYLERFGGAVSPLFRFPMLHQGADVATRDRAAAALGELGLSTAHVSVDTSEWILARAHAVALATGDAVLRREVGLDFVRHVTAAVEHADAVARRKTGRGVPQVLLLHANTLVEDFLDALLLALHSRGVDFVSLDEALSDPVYLRPDGYAGPKGLSWLYRMEPASPEDVAWDDAEAAAIEERFAPVLDDEPDPPVDDPVSWLQLAADAPAGLEAILRAAGGSERQRSLLVMHRGELVGEAYFHGAGPETAANLKSVTKTLTSALVGVALRRGCIESVEVPVAPLLAERYRARLDGETPPLTLRHLLTMSSGLTPVDYGTVQESDDWLAALLAGSTDAEARGTLFTYDTPVLQLLTAALTAACGEPVETLARDELLGPLGGEIPFWRTDPQGLVLGGNDAYLVPRDLARLGELYRRGGTVGERRILDASFVEESVAVQIVPAEPTINHGTLSVRGYGYLWWLLDLDGRQAYAALGHGGQVVLVVPAEELVVVFTSRWPAASSTDHYRHMTGLVRERLLPLFDEKKPGS